MRLAAVCEMYTHWRGVAPAAARSVHPSTEIHHLCTRSQTALDAPQSVVGFLHRRIFTGKPALPSGPVAGAEMVVKVCQPTGAILTVGLECDEVRVIHLH